MASVPALSGQMVELRSGREMREAGFPPNAILNASNAMQIANDCGS
jgi:hypothetical protein